MGVAQLFFLLFFAAFMGIPLWGIIDAAGRPESQWREADQNKVVWIVLQIIGGIIGAIAYFTAIRPKLKAVEARTGLLG